jgi:transposase
VEHAAATLYVERSLQPPAKEGAIEVIFTHGAGMEVHRKRITACRVTPDPTGQQADGLLELQDFGSMIADLLALSDWLAAVGVTHVAMENTGESSTPVYNILEESFTVFLVNAAYVKQVPGARPMRPMPAGWPS